MSNLPVPKYRALDSNGDPISGAVLHTYQSGTTTNQATYPTEADMVASTNANANPLVADADGYFGEIFLDDSLTYKLVLKTAVGSTTLWTADVINSATLASSALTTRVKQIAGSPLDFGAAGDGATDDTTEVQAAIDAATTTTVDLLGKTFKINGSLTIPSDTHIKNGEFDFTSSTADEYIKLAGTLGTGYSLDSDAAYQATALTATGATLAVGDTIVLFESSGKWVDNESIGELLTVQSYADPTVALRGHTHGIYASANSAQFKVITSVDNVSFTNVKFTCSTAPTGTNTRCISAKMAKRLRLTNCEFVEVDTSGAAIYLGGCNNVIIKGCDFDWTTSSDAIHFQGASKNITIKDCQFTSQNNLAACFASDSSAYLPKTEVIALGQVRGVRILNNSTDGDADFAILSEEVLDVEIAFNHINTIDTGASINTGGININVHHNLYHNPTGGGITFATHVPTAGTGRGYYIRCTDNVIEGDNADIAVAPVLWTESGDNAGELGEVRIERNTVPDDLTFTVGTSSDGASVVAAYISDNIVGGKIAVSSTNAANTLTTLTVKGNVITEQLTIAGTASNIAQAFLEGNHITASSSVKLVDIDNVAELHIRGNRLTGTAGTTANAIETTNVAGVRLSHNEIQTGDDTNPLILLTDATSILCNNNSVVATQGGALTISAPVTGFTSCTITNNQLTAGSAVDDNALHVTAAVACSNLMVSENTFGLAADQASPIVLIATTADVKISSLNVLGNIFNRTGNTDTALELTGNSTANINEGIVAGNQFVAGSVGVVYTNCISITTSPNSYKGSATATFSTASDFRALDFLSSSESGVPDIGAGSIGIRLNGTTKYIALFTNPTGGTDH